MKEKQVRKFIGDNNWNEFLKWMRGQTVSLVNGETDYYECDVYAFKQLIDTGYDRQTDPGAWD